MKKSLARTMPRLDKFHMLTAVWQEGDFYDQVWAQVYRQLNVGAPLNASERAVLKELLKRMNDRPLARRAIGIRPLSRTAARNQKIADHYTHLTMVEGKASKAASRAVEKKFTTVGARAIRTVLESSEYLPLARTRALATVLSSNSTPKK